MSAEINSIDSEKGILLDEMSEIMKDSLPSLIEIWIKMFGEDIEIIKDRFGVVKRHVSDLFQEMIDEQQDSLEINVRKVEDLTMEIMKYRDELSMEDEIKMPSPTLSLTEMVITLEKIVENLKDLKEKKMLHLRKLQKQEMQLTTILGLSFRFQHINKVPSSEELFDIQEHVTNLECLKAERLKEYLNTKREILILVEELEFSNMDQFTMMVVEGDENEFILSERNMSQLRELKTNLKQRIELEKLQNMELRQKLTLLWDRLEVNPCDRERFLQNNKGYGSKINNALKREIQICEELKKENIKEFILRIRHDIEKHWNLCHFSQEERLKFKEFFIDIFDENTLDAHEMEFERLKRFYNETSKIFELIENREKLWARMIALEKESSNSVRLFDNRGGKLLKEEKERKRLQKELPRKEEELEKMLEKFKENYGRPFMYNGYVYLDRINEQWLGREAAKENLKKPQSSHSTYVTPARLTPSKVKTPASEKNPRAKKLPFTPIMNI